LGCQAVLKVVKIPKEDFGNKQIDWNTNYYQTEIQKKLVFHYCWFRLSANAADKGRRNAVPLDPHVRVLFQLVDWKFILILFSIIDSPQIFIEATCHTCHEVEPMHDFYLEVLSVRRAKILNMIWDMAYFPHI
jgi:hypothetical protein